MRRPALLLALLGMIAGLASALVAAPAFAHDELIGADPAPNAQVDALPAQIELTFSGVLLDEAGATEVVVKDAAGTDLTDGAPSLDGTHLRQSLQGSASGEITVIWRVVSSDGHPVSNQYTFTVGASGAPVAPTGTATPLPGPAMQATDLTWVWIALGVVLVGLGGALVAVLVAKARGPRED